MSSTTADLSYECPCFTLGRWTRPVRLGKAKPADLPEPELSGDPRVSDRCVRLHVGEEDVRNFAAAASSAYMSFCLWRTPQTCSDGS
eukprot:767058-Hanusia_phi.AAC.5